MSVGSMHFRCALGRGGLRRLKREGDGATPVGRWQVLRILYRSDRQHVPRSGIPIRTIRSDDGWCDDPGDRNYNRPVRHPYPASAEAMWRDDHLYDLVVVLDHNTRPRLRHGGSAIFMHLARENYEPTAGCIALSKKDLTHLLSVMSRGTRLVIR